MASDVAPRVLVVDDDTVLADVVAGYLRREGFQVDFAADGASGLRQALSTLPDLVVLDRMLPDMDGLDVCRRLRKETSIPVVMLTGLTEENDRIAGLEGGADDYVVKPFSPRELAVRVRTVLRRAGKITPPADSEAHAGGAETDLIGVLGPLRVVVDGKDVTPSAPKQRLLLALLVSHAGRPLSPDRLIDLVWDEQPPPSARDQLRWHLHHLKQTLGGEERLKRTADGYVFAVRPGELDVDAFERLCKSGMTADGVARTAETLTEALALWRGPAYGDLVNVTVLAAESDRLDELRLAALERRINADLELGKHAELVAELRRLVAEYPLRERFREQLMRALHRGGRRDDALEVFRQGRELSVELLGLEPGKGLRDLEREVLADEPEEAAPTTPAPAELPAELPVFTGRTAETELLADLVTRGDGRPTVLTGPGGVGKSTLAVHVGRRVAKKYPDGQLYVNLHGATPKTPPLEPSDGLAHLLRSLGADAPAHLDVAELAARFRSACAGRRLLLVL
ncbi:MAG: BTAD domain-containing putative transcriptional regulator, partial [Stackebrandtia sp.]